MTTEARLPIKAFISHATEDKERFVEPFATALREKGIDAWVDKWEIRAGDSLVHRIFDEGIPRADAIVVVLSHVSVGKPWVTEELHASVVRRITTERKTRLIPIVLDEDVDVPSALKHLLWVSVPRVGLDGAVQQVVNNLYGVDQKPPLGAPPAFAAQPVQQTHIPADETVLRLLFEHLQAHDSANAFLLSDAVRDRALAVGLSEPSFIESVQALAAAGQVSVTFMTGSTRFIINGIPNGTWLNLEASKGVDVEGLRTKILSDVVNQDIRKIEPVTYGASFRTVQAVLQILQAQQVLRFAVIRNSELIVTDVSPLARRALLD